MMPFADKFSQNKLQYGVRNVLNGENEFDLNNALYIKELFDSYNSSVNNLHLLEKSKVNSIVSSNVTLVKLLHNVKLNNYLSIKNGHKLVVSPLELLESKTFFYDASLPVVMNMVENTIKDSSINTIYKFVVSDTADGPGLGISSIGRTQARLLNIIDLNVVPINVHALLREVPLINMYNYAHTYNAIVEDTIVGKENTLMKDVLLDPYTKINVDNYSQYEVMMSGDMNSLNLNKPRYLSDQLFGKVLLNGINQKVSIERANTKLIQNVVFLCNLQRVLRVNIKSKLDTINTRIVEKIKITSKQITEYSGSHNKYDDDEFHLSME